MKRLVTGALCAALLAACGLATLHPMDAPVGLPADRVASDRAACETEAQAPAWEWMLWGIVSGLSLGLGGLHGGVADVPPAPSAAAYTACLARRGYRPSP